MTACPSRRFRWRWGHRRIDVLGVVVSGLAVSLGGSLFRDMVLNQPPVVVWMNWYLPVAGAAATVGMLLQPVFARADRLITVPDAVVMGLFGAIAASKALSPGVGEAGALVVGAVRNRRPASRPDRCRRARARRGRRAAG